MILILAFFMIVGFFMCIVMLFLFADMFKSKETREKEEKKIEGWVQGWKKMRRQKIIEEELIRQEVRDKLKEEGKQ